MVYILPKTCFGKREVVILFCFLPKSRFAKHDLGHYYNIFKDCVHFIEGKLMNK